MLKKGVLSEIDELQEELQILESENSILQFVSDMLDNKIAELQKELGQNP